MAYVPKGVIVDKIFECDKCNSDTLIVNKLKEHDTFKTTCLKCGKVKYRSAYEVAENYAITCLDITALKPFYFVDELKQKIEEANKSAGRTKLDKECEPPTLEGYVND